jgi:CMP-N-acetylneuraminic acid synthetase
MTIVGFVFARGGSKGLPGKNIRVLAGKPLIAWSIEQAKAVNRIERVIVSTDSNEIADVARSFGAEVPFIRPAELAQDDSPEWLSWQHALRYLRDHQGTMPDTMISIPTTAPLRIPADLDNCLDEYAKGKADAVITVTNAHRNPYFNMVTMDFLGNIQPVIPQSVNFSRRQDCPTVYDMTSVAYVVDARFVLNNSSLFAGKVRAVHVPVERAIDIDTLLDFKIAEVLLFDRAVSKIF